MKKIVSLLCLITATIAGAQRQNTPATQQSSPATQIRWPADSGNGPPASPTWVCNSGTYGQPYTDLTNNNQYTCSTSGWVQVNSTSGGGTTTPSPYGQVPFYSASGTASTLTGDPEFIRNSSGSYIFGSGTSGGSVLINYESYGTIYIQDGSGNIDAQLGNTSGSGVGSLILANAGATKIALDATTGTGTFNGTVQSHTLTDGTCSISGGALTGCATGQSGGNPYTYAVNYGDSITQATGTTCFMAPGIKGQVTNWVGDEDLAAASCLGPTGYAYLVQSDFGNGGYNCGRGGDASTDMTWHSVLCGPRPLTQNNPVRTAMIGTNDNSLCSTNTNCQDTTTKAEFFSAAEVLIPDNLKSFVSGANCTASSGWSAGDIMGSLTTTTSGSTLACTFPSSTTIAYVAYEKCDNTGSGTGTLTVNGAAGTLEPSLIFYGLGSTPIYYGNGTSFATGSGQFSHCTLALARNTGIAGSNSVTFTPTGTGKAEIFWMAGSYVAPTGTIAPPLLVQNGVPYENDNAGQPGVGQYNTISHGVYTTLHGDGLNILWADVQASMNYTTDFTGGTEATGDAVCGVNSPSGAPWAASWLLPLHPGDGGACHMYEADHVALATAGILPSVQSQALQIWAGPFGSITGANSLGGADGADGGVNGVGTSSLLSFSNTGYASTIGTDYALPGYDKLGFYYSGAGQTTTGQSGGMGLLDTITNVYGLFRASDGTMCFNATLADLASCNSGETTFFNGSSAVALNRLTTTGNVSGNQGVTGLQFRAPGLNSLDLQFWGTGNGAGLDGAGGLFDETTTHFVWSTNTTDDIYGYTPVSNVSAGTGATWSILHTGFATFPQVSLTGGATLSSCGTNCAAVGTGGGDYSGTVKATTVVATGMSANSVSLSGSSSSALLSMTNNITPTGPGVGIPAILSVFPNIRTSDGAAFVLGTGVGANQALNLGYYPSNNSNPFATLHLQNTYPGICVNSLGQTLVGHDVSDNQCNSTATLTVQGDMGSGTASNTDLVGELSFTAATSASYTFAVTTHAIHPECFAQAQASTATSGDPYITYTGATAFTINFPVAFTGSVSYHCLVRD
jgi:hypothetical protein